MVLAIALVSGCSGGSALKPDPTIPLGGTVVTDNVTTTTGWKATQDIVRGTVIWVRLCRRGTEVREHPVTFIAAKTENGENLISVETPSTLAVVPGDSGSQVGWTNPATRQKEVLGQLCYGTGSIGDSTHFKARHIDEVMSVDSRAVSRQAAQGYKPIENINFLSGIDQKGLDRLRAAKFAVPVNTRATKTPQPTRGGADSTPIAPVAGMKISVNDITGDVFTGGAIGTIGYVNPDRLFIFGHAYDMAGDTDIPATLANMTFVTGGLTAYCDATPMLDQPLGTVTKDYMQGCVVKRNQEADTIKVSLEDWINGVKHEHSHQIVKGSPGKEIFYIGLSTMAILDFDRAKYAKGTAAGTLTLNFSNGTETLDLNCSDEADVVNTLYGLVSDFLWEKVTTSRTLISVGMNVIIVDDYTHPSADPLLMVSLDITPSVIVGEKAVKITVRNDGADTAPIKVLLDGGEMPGFLTAHASAPPKIEWHWISTTEEIGVGYTCYDSVTLTKYGVISPLSDTDLMTRGVDIGPLATGESATINCVFFPDPGGKGLTKK